MVFLIITAKLLISINKKQRIIVYILRRNDQVQRKPAGNVMAGIRGGINHTDGVYDPTVCIFDAGVETVVRGWVVGVEFLPLDNVKAPPPAGPTADAGVGHGVENVVCDT